MHRKFLFPLIYIVFFTILIIQIGCYTVPLEIRKDNPIEQLAYKYSIHLDSTWSTIHAQTLENILESISPNPGEKLIPSKWTISHDEMQNDIQIESRNNMKTVAISSDVFPNEGAVDILAPERRLFNAAVVYISENGTNRSALVTILKERYDIIVDIPSYEILTQLTTKENTRHYADFENKDLMLLISVFEDFPQALHKVPQLKYIICRIDDDIRAAGVAWTTNQYIELVQSMFNRNYTSDTRRVIAHEKAHFLWSHLFPAQLKNNWQELGGWYKDPKNEEGWSTNKDRKTFVSDYAHTKNPNEDMAETLAFYLVYPDRLRSINPAKYDFIRNRIMKTYGARYVSLNRM
ncbi:MAG: hypothetical protein OXD54_02110 [Candidatus Poribacteria bacterium]|nr:hypothetical protein [Candidatus Poribacteria bacterium]